MEALLGPKTEADLVKPDKKQKQKAPKEKKDAAATPAAPAAAAANGSAAAAAAPLAEEAWRTADPYAFLSKPQASLGILHAL